MAGFLLTLGATLILLTPTMASAKSGKAGEPLSSRLLTVGQLPTGWSVMATSTSGGIGCLHDVLEPHGITQTASASASFQNGNFPELDEKLATYKGVASKIFSKISDGLNGCKTATATENGTSITASIGQMSFPRFGNESQAFTVTLTVSGITAREDVLILREGSVVMGINEADVGTVDTDQFEGFVQTAIRDLTHPSRTGPRSPSSRRLPASVAIPTTMAGNAHPNLAAGPPGKLDVVYIGAPYNPGGDPTDGSILPIAVWNGTSEPVSDLDISGSAMSGGKIVGSGDSQDVEPPNLGPGQVAFGIVFFQTAVPSDANFNLTVTPGGEFSNTLSVQVTQANYVPGGNSGINDVVGSVSNPNTTTVMSPISTDVFCFTNGLLTAVEDGFASGNAKLPPAGTGSYDTEVVDACPTFLVGASGFSD